MTTKKLVIKYDHGENAPRSGKKLKSRPELSKAMILPNGIFGADIIGGRAK
jgi:hypothetical protein